MITTYRKLIRLSGMMALAACAGTSRSMGVPPAILDAKGDPMRGTLVDAMSVQPIASTEVEIYSDNGVRCIKASCPTDGKSWKGASDASRASLEHQ